MRVFKLKKMKRIHSLHFTPDGGQLLVPGGAEVRMVDDVVRIDLNSGDELARTKVWNDSAAVSPDGTRFVAGGQFATTGKSGGKVRWTNDGEQWHVIPVPRGHTVTGVTFDPSGERVAIGSFRDRRGTDDVDAFLSVVRLEEPATATMFQVLPTPAVIAFDRTGERVACTGGIDWEPDVAVHDAATGKGLFGVKPKGTQSRGLSFDDTGRLAVVNGKWVYVISPHGSDLRSFVLEAPKQMNAAVFSPDGKRILTGDHAGALRVWDASDGKELKSFDWQIGPITAVSFAPDGLTCAAAGTNGRVVLWDVDE